MKKILFVLAIIMVFGGNVLAQKGTAESGYYPMGYAGDTWTGIVTVVNENTREFTLTYKKGDKEQTFVGVLVKGYTARKDDGKDYEVLLSELMGLRLRAYYMTKTKKVDGRKIKTNEVFQIKFLDKGD